MKEIDMDLCRCAEFDAWCFRIEPREPGWVCTLPKRHSGPHIACFKTKSTKSSDHNVVSWTRDGEYLYDYRQERGM